MPFFGFRSSRYPKQNPLWQISTPTAFDMLVAEALRMEQFPNDILKLGYAKGFYDRIVMLGEKHNWTVSISITDKDKKE